MRKWKGYAPSRGMLCDDDDEASRSKVKQMFIGHWS